MNIDELSKQLSQTLDKALSSERFAKSGEQVVTDIYIQPLLEDGIINVLDDDDNIALSEPCGWLDQLGKSSFYDSFKKVAQKAVAVLKSGKSIAAVNIFQPFSFVLVDNKGEHLADIDVVDDDTIILSDDLLKGWEEDLDDFIKKLLED